MTEGQVSLLFSPCSGTSIHRVAVMNKFLHDSSLHLPWHCQATLPLLTCHAIVFHSYPPPQVWCYILWFERSWKSSTCRRLYYQPKGWRFGLSLLLPPAIFLSSCCLAMILPSLYPERLRWSILRQISRDSRVIILNPPLPLSSRSSWT